MLGFVRKHIAGNASFWGLVEYGIGPVAALIALPILFRQLGTVGFGQYSMIIALAGFGNAANLGAAVTATKLVSESMHKPGGAYRAAGVSLSLIGCALAVVTLAAVLLWGVVGLGWPAATFGGVAVTMLAMPALAIYLTQQYDQLFSGCLKGREDFRATALCEVFSRTGTIDAMKPVTKFRRVNSEGCLLSGIASPVPEVRGNPCGRAPLQRVVPPLPQAPTRYRQK